MVSTSARWSDACAVVVSLLGLHGGCPASDLHVGPGRDFARIESAVAGAVAGDRVVVHPREHGAAYDMVAVLVHTPRVEIVAAERGIRLSGSGFDYSGEGRVPRAIVQFDPGSDGSSLQGFELVGARNASNNGAGVRINQANGISVRECDIHGNDMGIMSNGSINAAGIGIGASDQRFEACHVHDNGSIREQGYSHNFYLGGDSATLWRCVVGASTAGHNIKSRARVTIVDSCLVHDSANREIDLVDAKGFTDRPDSSAVIINSIIIKRANLAGNRGVIHFGRDGSANREGRLTIACSLILTPYATPAVQVSTANAKMTGVGSVVVNTGNRQASGPLLEQGPQVQSLLLK